MISNKSNNIKNYSRELHLTNTAREAWSLILRTLDSKAKVLLPSYIGVTDREGSGIYDPIINIKIDHDFYLLNEDLTISLNEIERCLIKEDYAMILLVHYFGFKIQNITAISRLCKQHNVLIVEDCAHLYNYNILNYSDVGTYGDFAFYSLHKFFPFQNGGMFIQNNLEIKIPNFSNIKLTSKLYRQFIKYDAKAIADKRIENFMIMDKLIKNIAGLKPLRKIKQGDIPHNYPIIIENDLREKLYFWLLYRKIPLIALYYRLINPLQNKLYLTMKGISDNILNLPIHQDMNDEEIEHVIDLLKQGLADLS